MKYACSSRILCVVLGLGLGLWTQCAAGQADKNDWWRHEVFYQIYPRSFKDSNGDGIGDLKGITSKLEYLADTGITATWLSPIYQSPMVDFGYDISDYRQIQPEYGTLADFDQLIAEANRLGIKIILDFVPNHSSNLHEWFIKSAAREPGYEDFYVWEDGQLLDDGTRAPPNNWVSVFSGSAWQWHEGRQQYYLRQFTVGQPDLNYRNPLVVEAMDEVLIYWLNKGVSGFRIDAVNYVFEDEELRDEPLSGLTTDANSPDYLQHIYTRNHPDDVKIIQHWRTLLDDYSKNNKGVGRIMMVEAYADLETTVNYYEDENGVQGAQFPFNFFFITDLNAQSDARAYVNVIQEWLTYMPDGHVANWVMGNHDNPRVGSRFNPKMVDALNMVLLTLPGIGVTYYGEEIGMLDYRDISWEDTVDKPACEAGIEHYKTVSRDPERTPFQWSNEVNAGFSTANKTWLPVNPNYKKLNLRAQQAAKRSHYKVYKSLLALRKSTVLREGNFIAQPLSRQVFAFLRELKGRHSIVTIVNVSNTAQKVDVSDFIDSPNRLIVQISGVDSSYKPGKRLKPDRIKLAPYEGIVCKLLVVEL